MIRNLKDILKRDLKYPENDRRFMEMTEDEARTEIRGICSFLTETAPECPEDYDSSQYKLWSRAVDVQLDYISRFRDEYGRSY